jgi:hypothetical protein
MLLLPLLIVGCSSSTKSDDAAKAKAAYLAKAEAICAKANVAQKALTTPTSPEELSPYVTGVVDIADTATTELDKLTPPPADKADLEAKVLKPLRDQLARGHEYATKVEAASKAKDNTALITLLGDPPNKTVADLTWMSGYGFRECVSAADTSG